MPYDKAQVAGSRAGFEFAADSGSSGRRFRLGFESVRRTADDHRSPETRPDRQSQFFLRLDKSTGFSVYEDNGSTFYDVGDPNPKTLLGVSSTFRYKKFSIIANMNGNFGQDIYNATLMNLLNVGGIKGGNIALSVFQDPVKESFSNPAQSPSSRYIEKGSYLKMTNMTISYNVGDVAKTFKGTNLYITAQNLFLITKYSGFDPEVNVDRNINGIPSFGIDYARYPSSRSFILGINFSL